MLHKRHTNNREMQLTFLHLMKTSSAHIQFGMFLNLPFDVFLDREFNLKLSKHQIVA